MQYDAVTIDTNIFRHKGWRLEDGMIGQLAQFKDSSAQFILSEIVVKEVHKYLEIEANEAKVALVNAIKKCTRNGLLSPGTLAQLNDISNSTSSPEDVAKQRFQAFTDVTGMIIVPAELTEIKELIKRYFRPAAPFEASGKKKNEFPDAIALLSLEKWGESNGKRILAISDDGGWADFAKDSEWVDVEKDFAAALQLLQQQSEQAKVLIASLLKDMDSGSRPELLHQVTNAIDSAVELMDVFAEASSAFHFEENLAILTYQDFHFLTRDGDYEFKIVQIGKDKIVAMIDLSIIAEAECDFSFAVWDSIDREYVPMGSTNVKTKVEFDATALITFEGDFSATPREVEMSNLELLDTIGSVDFGEVDMDDDWYED